MEKKFSYTIPIPEHCDYNYAQPIRQDSSSPNFVTVSTKISAILMVNTITLHVPMGLNWSENVNPPAYRLNR